MCSNPVDRATATRARQDATRPTSAPRRAGLVWLVLALLPAAEAAHELAGIPGSDTLYAGWLNAAAVTDAAAICLARAASRRNERGAWLALGIALFCWAAGTALSSLLDGHPVEQAHPGVPDALWLLWYPLAGLGIALLFRDKFGRVEAHRWMDGFSVMLLALAATFPLTLEPAEKYLQLRPLAAIVDLSYPILDTLLLGAILGILGLLAWRPGKVWLTLSCGCAAITIADAANAAAHAGSRATAGHYGFLWATGALLIARAAWLDAPPQSDEPLQLHGLKAIALPLTVQLLAVSLQICIVLVPSFDTPTHRIVVLVVLIIATIQLVLSRPRGERSQPPGSGTTMPTPSEASRRQS